MHNQHSQHGFTLIEISIVLLIVGIIISVIGTVLPSIVSTSKIKRTNATLEKFDYSLQGYMVANSRLPCPDTDGDGRENLAGGAGSDCSSYTGSIPFIDIGVSSGNDPFNNPVGYAVYGTAGATEVDLTNSYADSSDFLNNGLHAANNEIAAAGGFVNNKVYTTFSDINNVVDNSTRTGQAYVLVSGGQRDINAPAGFYDHLNFTGNTQFVAPNKINTDSYDDSVLAQGPNFLAGKHFTGVAAGGTSTPTGAENTNALCMDGTDNDSDGATDCADSDCSSTAHCTSQTSVTVASTPALPVGSVGAAPSYTFSASGGSSSPLFYWTISNISSELSGDLGVNYFTGAISGSYAACPGNYTLTIRADDRNDGGNFDTEDFSIAITNGGLGVLPLPSGGVDFTVDSTIFNQTFTLTGGTAGTTQWQINWIGSDPSGLSLQNSGDNTAQLSKNGSSNSGTYAFTIRISDADCPGNTFTSPTYTLEVTGNGSAPPIDSGLVAEWRFDESAWTIAPGDVKDTSENSNDGTIRENAALSTADPAVKTIPGTCSYAAFDGSRDYIRVPNDTSLTFNGQITIAAWVKMERTAGSQMIAYQGYGPSPNRANFMRIQNGRLRVGKQSPYRAASYTIPASDIGTWVHFTGMYNGSAWQIYKNGTLVAYTTTNEGAIPVDRDWFIGGYGNNHTLLGGIDQLRLYNRALSIAEINQVMNLSNDCAAATAVLPSCGLSPNNGIVMTTYDQTGAGHPANAAEYDTLVSTYAIASNVFGSGVQTQINGFGNPYGSDDRYLSLFTGYLEVPESGYYTFAVDGDDAVDIAIGGNVVTGWYGGHGRNNSANFPASIALQAGFHEITYRHEEVGGGDSYFLYWQKPADAALQITAASAFKHCP